MDAHPIVREHFADYLEQHHPDACREGHHRLYQHLKESAKELPDTFEEMMPLYQAVTHGCKAGLHQEAYDEIYSDRIRRRNIYYSTRHLGAYGSELSVISNFFEKSWDRINPNLRDATKGFLFNIAGTCLGALNRLEDSIVPIKQGVELQKSSPDLANASTATNNLAAAFLTLGDLREALKHAKRGVELAEMSADLKSQLITQATLAKALHYNGRLRDSEDLFQETEKLQARSGQGHRLLHSVIGFDYCDLLLDPAELFLYSGSSANEGMRQEALERCQQVRMRTNETIKLGTFLGLISEALDHLTLGRSFLLEATLGEERETLLLAAEEHLDKSISGLRKAGIGHHRPRGFIARAQFRRVQYQHYGDEPFAKQAQQDLDEASQISSRGPMPLLQADIALEQSRLHHTQGHLDQARQSLSKARALIQKHAYHRRDPELEGLEELLKG